jgi:hypothetical protein
MNETAKNEFSIAVEKKAQEMKIPLITSLAMVCAECQIEPEKIPKMISKSLKDKLEAEATAARRLKVKRNPDIFTKFG